VLKVMRRGWWFAGVRERERERDCVCARVCECVERGVVCGLKVGCGMRRVSGCLSGGMMGGEGEVGFLGVVR
jgi:hypothetical protein